MAVSIFEVALVSIFLESFLYGVFAVLFAISIFILFTSRRKDSNGEVNKPMLVTCLALFTFSTVHIATDLRRLLDAFIRSDDPSTQLVKIDDTTYIVKSAAYTAQTWVGDGLMIYRLYLVWNGDKRAVFPIYLCFLASVGVGIGALRGFAGASSSSTIFQLHNWVVSFFAITLVVNFACTSLIAARLLYIHRTTQGVKVFGRSLIPAATIIIESGAIYSVCLITLLVLFLSGSYAQYIALDAVTQIIGVVFSFVIVRVVLGISSENRRFNRSTLRSSYPRIPQSLGQPFRPVNVNISTMSHTNAIPDTGVEETQSDFAHKSSGL
ncbi:hypothetical protein BJ138DRAFT_783527 [Hygrophoropsis aurantiaca]|uniref:Uncharacterized protein n=1 Tax=Hygrophoropsis aurantiaca TaxID=72124 RepID=A0ACB8AGK7_9AGAM|nr:hypothetical protein BJ138DRAFT_783527 [Hygrophoropsis aurantiaca]